MNLTEFKKWLMAARPSGSIRWMESPSVWERDYNIYGGISYLVRHQIRFGIEANLNAAHGNFVSVTARKKYPFWAMTMEQKFEASAHQSRTASGTREGVENPLFCGWRRVKWNEGSWLGHMWCADGYKS